ncbi:ArsR/SmtB family transcription factor [Algicella marina]|uniref:Metalloregulator ArsR/SmtB family transcription factor n=1 Tax=Algicella marina TaxID=2683284 RepID=A0A6P1T0D8_9RHOB|nr:metalloregulator ArsR/SmtB family transcription factor [Algicella marina]QHQ34906.1 metalloregulator ArsR/SmtB family transcription factor [Algicella marina]
MNEETLVYGETGAKPAAEVLKALGHTGRFTIMCQLVHGEKSVNTLEGILGIRQAAVSQQLARLRQDGLVKHRREGKSIYYSVANPRIEEMVRFLCGHFKMPH